MDDQPNDLFIGLVASLQMSAWMALGKVINPMTQKIERDLDQARETIDLLGVLEEKTRGNLHADESRLLQRSLYELRLNYVDELKTAATQASDAPPLDANMHVNPSDAPQVEPPRPPA
jgi:hypothetical protein